LYGDGTKNFLFALTRRRVVQDEGAFSNLASHDLCEAWQREGLQDRLFFVLAPYIFKP